MTCQHVSWPPIKVQVCLRWPSLAPSQGRHNRGREVLPYCCQSRSSTKHMKGMHSRFYGPRWLHKPLLCSEFMYPIARINNASLIRDPRNQDPWREQSWGKKKSSAMCAVSVLCSSANHHPQEHFYWKEFISELYQRCPSVYFPTWGDCWALTEVVASTQGKIMLQTSGCLQRYTGDSFHEFPSVCILLPSVILSWLLHLFFT